MKIGDEYPRLVRKVLEEGVMVSPRGKSCFSLKTQLLRWDVFPNVPKGIGFNKKFAIAELVATVIGYNNVEWLAQFNPNVRQFSDDGVMFHGHYGERLEFQWETAIERIRSDFASRQAILQIWDWHRDSDHSKDFPCNVVFQLYREDEYLNMAIFQRSSDLIWGLPYDHFMFGCLLRLLAKELKLETGQVVRFITDAHIYADGVYYPAARIKAARDVKEWTMWDPGMGFSDFYTAATLVVFAWQDKKLPTEKRALALAEELGLCG